LPKDPASGRLKGHAIIEYSRHRDAKNAVREMNGFDVLGRQLKCSIVTDQMNKSMLTQAANRDFDLDEDAGGQYIHSA
jgi:RNA recognition motif-containing protein